MSAYLRLFVSPNGSIGKRTYWHGVIVVAAVNVALLLGVRFVKEPTNLFTLPLLAPLATLWFSICITAKRLRRIGASPWRLAPARALVTLGLVGIMTLSTYDLAHDQRPRGDAWLALIAGLAVLGGALDDVYLLLKLGLFARDKATDVLQVFA